MQKNDPKTLRAWAMYDWANSVFMLVITSAVFPAYYNQVTRVDGSSLIQVLGFTIENTAAYSVTLGIAFGIIALISPFLSGISDYTGNPKVFMKFFCYLGALSCSALFFFTGPNVHLALGALLLATVGYSGSIVFYNAYLPEIATEDKQDRVSAQGYTLGYIGACTLLILNLFIILNRERLGIEDGTLPPRIAFLATGIWWIAFAQIPFTRLPKKLFSKTVEGHYLTKGYQELKKVWGELQSQKPLRIFHYAFFFYIMGLQTVMFMAASFGEKEVHLQTQELIIVVLINQLVGTIGAYAFARFSGRWGNIQGLMTAVLIWVVISISAYFITTSMEFYVAAVAIGLVMGGIQALSRSTYSKMIPKTENNTAYFSFYDVTEKIATMCGLFMFGYLDNLTGSMRNSIVALAIFFLIGFLILVRLLFIVNNSEIRMESLSGQR